MALANQFRSQRQADITATDDQDAHEIYDIRFIICPLLQNLKSGGESPQSKRSASFNAHRKREASGLRALERRF
jgi:hypothetical protein